MDGKSGISINMPCAPMPVPEGDAPAFMHNRLVTSLTGNQPYYMRGGLIPHLTKKGSFWKSQAPAIDHAVLKYRFDIDAVNSAHLDKLEAAGWLLFLGCIIMMEHGVSSLSCPDCTLKNVQYWVKQDGTTATTPNDQEQFSAGTRSTF